MASRNSPDLSSMAAITKRSHQLVSEPSIHRHSSVEGMWQPPIHYSQHHYQHQLVTRSHDLFSFSAAPPYPGGGYASPEEVEEVNPYELNPQIFNQFSGKMARGCDNSQRSFRHRAFDGEEIGQQQSYTDPFISTSYQHRYQHPYPDPQQFHHPHFNSNTSVQSPYHNRHQTTFDPIDHQQSWVPSQHHQFPHQNYHQQIHQFPLQNFKHDHQNSEPSTFSVAPSPLEEDNASLEEEQFSDAEIQRLEQLENKFDSVKQQIDEILNQTKWMSLHIHATPNEGVGGEKMSPHNWSSDLFCINKSKHEEGDDIAVAEVNITAAPTQDYQHSREQTLDIISDALPSFHIKHHQYIIGLQQSRGHQSNHNRVSLHSWVHQQCSDRSVTKHNWRQHIRECLEAENAHSGDEDEDPWSRMEDDDLEAEIASSNYEVLGSNLEVDGVDQIKALSLHWTASPRENLVTTHPTPALQPQQEWIKGEEPVFMAAVDTEEEEVIKPNHHFQMSSSRELHHNLKFEEPVKQNRCSAYDATIGDARQYREHFKTDWHKHNLRRKMRQLPPLSAEECVADVELGKSKEGIKISSIPKSTAKSKSKAHNRTITKQYWSRNIKESLEDEISFEEMQDDEDDEWEQGELADEDGDAYGLDFFSSVGSQNSPVFFSMNIVQVQETVQSREEALSAKTLPIICFKVHDLENSNHLQPLSCSPELNSKSYEHDPLKKEYKAVENGSTSYDFKFNARIINSTIEHFQLMNPWWTTLLSRVQISTMELCTATVDIRPSPKPPHKHSTATFNHLSSQRPIPKPPWQLNPSSIGISDNPFQPLWSAIGRHRIAQNHQQGEAHKNMYMSELVPIEWRRGNLIIIGLIRDDLSTMEDQSPRQPQCLIKRREENNVKQVVGVCHQAKSEQNIQPGATGCTRRGHQWRRIPIRTSKPPNLTPVPIITSASTNGSGTSQYMKLIHLAMETTLRKALILHTLVTEDDGEIEDDLEIDRVRLSRSISGRDRNPRGMELIDSS